MKNTALRTVLDELYALDPTLRMQEEELMPILEKLLKHKPSVEPDPAFVQKLRMMLKEKEIPQHSSLFSLRSSLFSMHTFNYAITGAVLGAIITGPVVYGVMQSGGIPSFPTDGTREQALFSYSVQDTKAEAFGDLSMQNIAGAYGQGGGSAEMDVYNPRPQSGGGGGSVSMGSDVDQKMLVAPEMTEYNLTFEGEMPALTAAQVDILKRQKGMSSADIGTIMQSFNTGLIDLNTFAGAKTDMLSFYQDKQYGYMVTVSFRDGSISMNANWDQWPHPEAQCQDEACFQRYRVKIGDIPSDDVLIGIADSFIKEHAVDLAQYGPAEVDNLWRQNYDATPDKSMFYVPDQMRVVYPQLVEGKPVYDEGGGKVGISVGVNIREKKVSDVWGIMDQKYLKSAYAGVTDAASITKYLENFGNIPTDWVMEGTTLKSVDITLGTPVMGYMKMYTYENATSEELIVPALIFPVTNVPAGEYFYRNTIAVPLAADMLAKMTQQPDPRPMPIEPLIMEDQPAVRATDE